MQDLIIEDEIFTKHDFTAAPLLIGEYEACIFNNCDFANLDFSNFNFIDCVFNACNLSLAKVNNTAMRRLVFKDCKMLGIRFDTCKEFGFSVSFEVCQLNHSSFYGRKMKKTIFKDSDIRDVEFARCDLSESVFDNSDLSGASFDATILTKADFRAAKNYNLDPNLNNIKKAKFSLLELGGLLAKYDIEIE